MVNLHPNLRVGTSSWSNAEWPFYPKGMKPGEFLGHYARRFSLVEVDSSFYHAPAPSLCSRWYQVVPEGFTFALKVPQTITHEKVLEDCEKEWESFLEAVRCLKEKLGYLLVQLPYFNKSSVCPSLGDFLKRLSGFLAKANAPCPLAVEVRNKTWIGKDLLAQLAERKAIFTITEQEWMPKPAQLWEKYGPELLTGPAAYVRLLGERKRIESITKTWEKLVIDRAEETRRVVELLRVIVGNLVVNVLVNNHWGGYAIASIELLEKLWNESPSSTQVKS
jgi:uncharacterized protein YecE (DUF72 family)